MFYYQHHIGDYLSHTANLSLLEHGVYTRLLQTYYMTEKPIPLDDPWRTVGARDSAERSAVEYILNTFFTKTDDGFVQSRCDKELLTYKEKSRKATESINSRWKNHKKDTNVIRTNNERITEVILTNNQAPIPKKNTVGSAKRRTQIPLDFFPNETGLQSAKAKGVRVDIELPKFKDFHTAKGSVMLDWDAAWRTWCTNSETFAKRYSPVVSSIDEQKRRNVMIHSGDKPRISK